MSDYERKITYTFYMFNCTRLWLPNEPKKKHITGGGGFKLQSLRVLSLPKSRLLTCAGNGSPNGELTIANPGESGFATFAAPSSPSYQNHDPAKSQADAI